MQIKIHETGTHKVYNKQFIQNCFSIKSKIRRLRFNKIVKLVLQKCETNKSMNNLHMSDIYSTSPFFDTILANHQQKGSFSCAFDRTF